MRGVLLQLVVAAVAAECGCATAVALRISQGPEAPPAELAYVAPAVSRAPLDASVLIRTDASATDRAAEPAPAQPTPGTTPWPAAAPVTGAQHVAQHPVAVTTRAIPASCSSGAAEQTIQLINGDRANAGLAPLTLDAGLCQAAQWHSAQNAGWDRMTHDGVYQDVSNAGVTYTNLGEVLGTCHPSEDPAFINNMWMQSPEHHGIIDSSQYLRIGVGWAQSSSGNWYVSAIVDS